jgi:hypothetical protein
LIATLTKYVFTPGTGNSQGCITLTNNDVTITDIKHIQNRGHYFKLTDTNNMQTLLVNIYAPLGYNSAKNEFFNNTIDVITTYDSQNDIFGGDFNITLTDRESLRRQRTIFHSNLLIPQSTILIRTTTTRWT